MNPLLDVVEYLITIISPEAINIQNDQGNTALHWAATNGHAKVVETLITKGKANYKVLFLLDSDRSLPGGRLAMLGLDDLSTLQRIILFSSLCKIVSLTPFFSLSLSLSLSFLPLAVCLFVNDIAQECCRSYCHVGG